MLLAGGVLVVAPWKMIDPDALVRLTVGRTIVQLGTVPQNDPLSFPAPGQLWSHPEWLGDLIWYAAHAAAGEPGMQLLKLSLLCGAWVLVLLLARRKGAAVVVAVTLLLLLIPGLAWRFSLRNHLHALWLVPLYGLLLQSARSRPRRLLLLLPLGVLWANLHGSFPLGWVVLGVAAVQALAHGRRRLALAIGLLLCVHPLLGAASPRGFGNYGQIVDHLVHGAVYRELINEWSSPLQMAPWIAHLPLHLLAALGLLSLLPRCNRGPRLAGPALLLGAGLLLGYSSQRFIPLSVALAAPGVALNLSRWLQGLDARPRRLLIAGACTAAVAVLLYMGLQLRTDPRPPVPKRAASPAAMARFLARTAPAGARLFNSFDSGPWLLWLATPRVKLYIDPRNNQGAPALQRYVRQVLPSPGRFEQEVADHGITLAEVDGGPRMATLATHLRRSTRWKRIYHDGQHTLYALDVPANAGLIADRAQCE